MKFKEFMTLQLFADPEDPTPADPKPQDPETNPKEPESDPEPKAKYTDEDLDRIIARKIAEERKKQDKAVREAQRLANMSAEERRVGEEGRSRRSPDD